MSVSVGHLVYCQAYSLYTSSSHHYRSLYVVNALLMGSCMGLVCVTSVIVLRFHVYVFYVLLLTQKRGNVIRLHLQHS